MKYKQELKTPKMDRRLYGRDKKLSMCTTRYQMPHLFLEDIAYKIVNLNYLTCSTWFKIVRICLVSSYIKSKA